MGWKGCSAVCSATKGVAIGREVLGFGAMAGLPWLLLPEKRLRAPPCSRGIWCRKRPTTCLPTQADGVHLFFGMEVLRPSLSFLANLASSTCKGTAGVAKGAATSPVCLAKRAVSRMPKRLSAFTHRLPIGIEVCGRFCVGSQTLEKQAVHFPASMENV